MILTLRGKQFKRFLLVSFGIGMMVLGTQVPGCHQRYVARSGEFTIRVTNECPFEVVTCLNLVSDPSVGLSRRTELLAAGQTVLLEIPFEYAEREADQAQILTVYGLKAGSRETADDVVFRILPVFRNQPNEETRNVIVIRESDFRPRSEIVGEFGTLSPGATPSG